LGASDVLDYASWLPPEVEERKDKLLSQQNVKDPLAEVNRRLGDAADAPAQWREWLPLVLPDRQQSKNLPLAIRAAIGARVEETVEVVRPVGPDLQARLEFLEKYGRTLRLEPLTDEWIILAKRNTDHAVCNWLRAMPPPVESIRQAFIGASTREIINLIRTIPAGMRNWFTTDVAEALIAIGSPADKELSSVAREFAFAGDSVSIRALVNRFPDRLGAFAGWAAASGDSSNLKFLLDRLQVDIRLQAFEDYLSWGLQWIESATAQELEWPVETPKALVLVILEAIRKFYSDRRYKEIIAAIGTLLCCVAPADTAVYCEFAAVASGWQQKKEPFGTLFAHATERAHIAQGAAAARKILGVTDLHGERVIVLYSPGFR
jgi:hypothetical protein